MPPGIYGATMSEIEARFTQNERRRALFAGLRRVICILAGCGCPEVFLDGSFITHKAEPDDYDLCYEPAGMHATESLHEFLSSRGSRKADYFGDIFPRMPEPPYSVDYVVEWQKDGRQDDAVKGILRISLRQDDAEE